MKISAALLSVCVLASADDIQTGESLSLLQTAANVHSHSFGKDECKAAKADRKAAKAALKLARATFKSQKAAWKAVRDSFKATKAAQDEACADTKSKCGKKGSYFLTGYGEAAGCLNWSGARGACQAEGGDLVMVKDAAKDAEVVAFMKGTGTNYGQCDGPYPWMGGSCDMSSHCTWVDGSEEPWQKSGFAVDDPNQHYYTDGRWGTWNSASTAFGICECAGKPKAAKSKKSKGDDDATEEGGENTGVQPAGKPKPEVVMVYTEVTTETPSATADNRGDAKLVPNSFYQVSFEVLRNDLGSGKPGEYVTDVVVGDQSLGDCAPDGGDYDCTFFKCEWPGLPKMINSGATGNVPLNIKITGHSWDCDCDKDSWECSKQDTVSGRAKMTAVGRFTFTPMGPR